MSALEVQVSAKADNSEADNMYNLEVQIGGVGGENWEGAFVGEACAPPTPREHPCWGAATLALTLSSRRLAVQLLPMCAVLEFFIMSQESSSGP